MEYPDDDDRQREVSDPAHSHTASSDRATLEKDPADVAHMFDLVAPRYDVANEALTFSIVRLWRRATFLALAPKPGERILDLAAGTGTSTAHIARSGADVVACDISQGMIEVGRQRHPELTFVHGNATDLPFEDGSFDAVTISFGLRNVSDTAAALREMRRVVAPGGRVVITEFSTPVLAPVRSLYRGYLTHVMEPMARLISSDAAAYDYLTESILAWPDQRTLATMLAGAGWSEVEYRNLAAGVVAIHRARASR